MKLEIVNHNHNYPNLLAWQLSSLVTCKTKKIDITYKIYCADGDAEVQNVVSYFANQTDLKDRVKVEVVRQKLSALRNRANGRNEAALNTDADWVWFTDTDYVFLKSCWDDLYEQLNNEKKANFATPLKILESSWDFGDRLIDTARNNRYRVMSFDHTRLDTVTKHVAIGGIQLARGSIVRDIGYCPEMCGNRDSWDFRSDISFRKKPEMGKKKKLDLNFVARIRHSKRGYGNADWEKVRN